MRRGHALLISLIIGAAAIFGVFAATHSIGLGRSSARPAISSAEIVAHNRALDRTEAKLKRMLARNPAARPGAAGTARHRMIYVRPAPHIVTLHHGGHETDGERESDDGGAFDD
jgi:hypothetical protein